MSTLEDIFYVDILSSGFPRPTREFHFLSGRRYAADFAWVDYNLLVEIEGGVWSGGRHTRGKGFTEDCRKYNLAQIEGYDVLRFTAEMVESGEALDCLRKWFENSPIP